MDHHQPPGGDLGASMNGDVGQIVGPASASPFPPGPEAPPTAQQSQQAQQFMPQMLAHPSMFDPLFMTSGAAGGVGGPLNMQNMLVGGPVAAPGTSPPPPPPPANGGGYGGENLSLPGMAPMMGGGMDLPPASMMATSSAVGSNPLPAPQPSSVSVATSSGISSSTPLVPLAPADFGGGAGAAPVVAPVAPMSSASMQVQFAPAAASAGSTSAAPARGAAAGGGKEAKGKKGTNKRGTNNLTPAEKAKLHRDRNREHARSTRLRKKAYVGKLKELVEGLRAEKSEEARKRQVAVQHLAEVQRVRRAVIRTFLKFHGGYESDPRKWMTILEENFFLKQAVTPYRSFRRAEIEQETRMTRGIEAVIADAASMAVMVECIGSRSPRWMQIKREDFLSREEAKTGTIGQRMPHSIVRQTSRLQHAVSSLSSSSGSSTGNGSGGEEESKAKSTSEGKPKKQQGTAAGAGSKKVSSSSSGSDSRPKPSNDFHDYHAPSLPDPMLDSGEGSTGSESPTSDHAVAAVSGTKHVCTDSSSGDEEKIRAASKPSPAKKRRKQDTSRGDGVSSLSASSIPAPKMPQSSGLPPNIARAGGISHNIKAAPVSNVGRDMNSRLSVAPAIPLPPFLGLGKRPPVGVSTTTTVGAAIMNKPPGAAVSGEAGSASTALVANSAQMKSPSAAISKIKASVQTAVAPASSSAGAYPAPGAGVAVVADNETTSSQSSNQYTQIQAYYHVNEDDMLLTDDVLMCPFIFRSQDAVMCGALAECITPGMLRAQFSQRNKLVNLEIIYDSMGFMQQLERASGREGSAQIVPNSLEMALSPLTDEARVITMAKPPFLIVSVNEVWTRTTKYTQMEVEGKEMSILNGKRTDPEAGLRPGKPIHDFAEVAKGRCACSVNIHYDKHGRDFVDFVCSYPLTNANDEITHLLHVCKELPVPVTPDIEFPGPSGSVSFQDQS